MNINEQRHHSKARALQIAGRAIDAANTEKLTLLDRFALIALDHILRGQTPEEEFNQECVSDAYAIATAIADRRGVVMEMVNASLPLQPEDVGDLNG